MHDRYTAVQHTNPCAQRLTGVRRAVYWCGRILQGLGLVLLWCMLLLFAGTASMGVLIYWSVIAIAVFYCGWVCATWVKRQV
jgi:hypothetical protein